MKKLFTNLIAIPALLGLLLTSCGDPKPEPTPGPAKTPTIVLSVSSQDVTTATIAAAVEATEKIVYTCYEKGKRPADTTKIVWKELATTQNGKYDLVYSELTPDTEYTAEAYAVNKDAKSAFVTKDFKTIAIPSSLAVSDVIGGANMVSFKATFDTDCNGFFYAITPKASYDEEKFIDDCYPVGFGQVLNDVGKKSGDVYKNQLNAAPMPNTEYVLAVIGAQLNKDGVIGDKDSKLIGGVTVIDIKTTPIEVNASDVTVGYEMNDADVTFAVAKAKVTRADDKIRGIYHGMFVKSEMGGKTIDQAVVDWLNEKIENEFGSSYRSQILLNFDGSQNTIEVQYNVKPSTTYIFFSVGYNQSGMIGKVVSKEVTSKSVSFDSGATVDAVLTPNITTVGVDLTFKDECKKVLFVYGVEGAYTDQSAQDELLINSANEYSAHWTSEMTGIELTQLEAGKKYDLYMLPVNAQGKFGKIIKKSFQTQAITFESAAKVAVKVTKVVLSGYVFDYSIELTYSGGAVSCEYITSWADQNDTKTAEEHARHMYSNGSTFTKTAETSFVKQYQETEKFCKVVFVPIDADGKRGAPVMFTIDNEVK